MAEYALAILTASTQADLLGPGAPGDLPLRVVHSTGDALAILEHEPECRLLVVERECEPQLGRLVQRVRRRIPALEILWLAPAVGAAPRHELAALRVEWLDRTLPPADLHRTLQHRFQRG